MKTKNLITLLVVAGLLIISGMNLQAQPDPPDPVMIDEHDLLEHWEVGDYYAVSSRSNEKNSRLMLSKRYDGDSVEKEGTFNIEGSTTRLKLSIDGSVKSGSITIALHLPDGKPYKTLSVDDSADIHWSESITIKEGEKKYHGDWKYKISAKTAKGSYHLSINTY